MAVLTEPAPALTDLVLGLATGFFALRAYRWPEVSRHWWHVFAWTALAGLAGFVHHAVLVRWQPVASVAWAVISVIVVLSLSCLLAASAEEVRGPGPHPVIVAVRLVSVVAFAALAAAMLASAVTIVACEAVLMALLVALWVQGWRDRHPMAPLVWAAIAVSVLGAVTQAVVGAWSLRAGMSAYHALQVVAFGLIFLAVRRVSAR